MIEISNELPLFHCDLDTSRCQRPLPEAWVSSYNVVHASAEHETDLEPRKLFTTLLFVTASGRTAAETVLNRPTRSEP